MDLSKIADYKLWLERQVVTLEPEFWPNANVILEKLLEALDPHKRPQEIALGE